MPQKNAYKSHKGRSAIARRVINGGAGENNGIMSPKSFGGGNKKGGSGPTATAFMRPSHLATANAKYPVGPGRINYLFVFKTAARPFGALQYVNAGNN